MKFGYLLICLVLCFLNCSLGAKSFEVYDIRGRYVGNAQLPANTSSGTWANIPNAQTSRMLSDFPIGRYIIKEIMPYSYTNFPKNRDAFAWQDVTAQVFPLLETNTNAIAVADFNGDGRDDIFEYCALSPDQLTGASKLYIRHPEEGFVEESASRLPDISAQGFTVQVLDVQNDGHKDILLIDESYNDRSTTNVLLINDGTGHFTYANQSVLPPVNALDAVIGDFNQDSFDDIAYLVIDDGLLKLHLWINIDGEYLMDQSAERLPFSESDIMSTDFISILDLNQDSHLDIIMTNSVVNDSQNNILHNGEDLVLLNDGAGFFDLPPINPLSNLNRFLMHYYPIDYNNDGVQDLLLNFSIIEETGSNSIGIFELIDSLFVEVVDAIPNIQYHHNNILIDDFTQDGYPDIFLPCVLFGEEAEDIFLVNNQDGTFANMAEALPGNVDFTIDAAIIDLNFDDKADLALGNSGTDAGIPAQNKLYQNSTITSIDDPVAPVPEILVYPNPFKDSVHLQTKDKHIDACTVYNLKGQIVKSFKQTAAVSSLTWNGEDDRGSKVAQGIYLLRFHSGSDTYNRKVLYLK